MAVTLSDVARLAGVSEATASRVLNGRRYVADRTRARVEDAARTLDYVPNRAARDLSMARTATVALLVHHAQYPSHGEGTFSSRVIDGVSHALRGAGFDLLYVPVDDAAVRHIASLPTARSGRSDGVLVLGPAFPHPALAGLLAGGRAVVTIDDRVAGADAVLAENRGPMADLVRHLVRVHGHRRITCLAGPARWPSTFERVAGVREGARGGDTTVAVLRARETTMRDGAELVGRLLEDMPDAIVCVNDAMAIGALHRLRTHAPLTRPAVTGFDDIAWAELTDPPLTTVAVDATAIGRAAASLLLERIAAGGGNALPGREVRVPATLRVRRSCGCPEPGSETETASRSVRPDGTGPARRRFDAEP